MLRYETNRFPAFACPSLEFPPILRCPARHVAPMSPNGAGGLPEHRTHARRQAHLIVLVVREEMPVHVIGHADRRMPQKALQTLRLKVLRDTECGKEMAQRMHAVPWLTKAVDKTGATLHPLDRLGECRVRQDRKSVV